MRKKSVGMLLAFVLFYSQSVEAAIYSITDTVFAYTSTDVATSYSLDSCGEEYVVEGATKSDATEKCNATYSRDCPEGSLIAIKCGDEGKWQCTPPAKYSDTCDGTTGAGSVCLGKYVSCDGESEKCGNNDRLRLNETDGTESIAIWRKCKFKNLDNDSLTCASKYKYYTGRSDDPSNDGVDVRRFYQERLGENSYAIRCLDEETYDDKGNKAIIERQVWGEKSCPWDAQTLINTGNGKEAEHDQAYYKYEFCLPNCLKVLPKYAITGTNIDKGKLEELNRDYDFRFEYVGTNSEKIKSVPCPFGQVEAKCAVTGENGNFTDVISYCRCGIDTTKESPETIYKSCPNGRMYGKRCYNNTNNDESGSIVYSQFCLPECKEDETKHNGNIHPDKEACEDNMEANQPGEPQAFLQDEQSTIRATVTISGDETLAFASAANPECDGSPEQPIWCDYYYYNRKWNGSAYVVGNKVMVTSGLVPSEGYCCREGEKNGHYCADASVSESRGNNHEHCMGSKAKNRCIRLAGGDKVYEKAGNYASAVICSGIDKFQVWPLPCYESDTPNDENYCTKNENYKGLTTVQQSPYVRNESIGGYPSYCAIGYIFSNGKCIVNSIDDDCTLNDGLINNTEFDAIIPAGSFYEDKCEYDREGLRCCEDIDFLYSEVDEDVWNNKCTAKYLVNGDGTCAPLRAPYEGLFCANENREYLGDCNGAVRCCDFTKNSTHGNNCSGSYTPSNGGTCAKTNYSDNMCIAYNNANWTPITWNTWAENVYCGTYEWECEDDLYVENSGTCTIKGCNVTVRPDYSDKKCIIESSEDCASGYVGTYDLMSGYGHYQANCQEGADNNGMRCCDQKLLSKAGEYADELKDSGFNNNCSPFFDVIRPGYCSVKKAPADGSYCANDNFYAGQCNQNVFQCCTYNKDDSESDNCVSQGWFGLYNSDGGKCLIVKTGSYCIDENDMLVDCSSGRGKKCCDYSDSTRGECVENWSVSSDDSTQCIKHIEGKYCADNSGKLMPDCNGATQCCEFTLGSLIGHDCTGGDDWGPDPSRTGVCVMAQYPAGNYCADGSGKYMKTCENATQCCKFLPNQEISGSCTSSYTPSSSEIENSCSPNGGTNLDTLPTKSGQYCFNSNNSQSNFVLKDCDIFADKQVCEKDGNKGQCLLNSWGGNTCTIESTNYDVQLSQSTSVCAVYDEDTFTTYDGQCKVAGYFETQCPENNSDASYTVCCHILDNSFLVGTYTHNIPDGEEGRLCSRSYIKGSGDTDCTIKYIHKAGYFCAKKHDEKTDENGRKIYTGQYPVVYNGSEMIVPSYKCGDVEIPQGSELLCCNFGANEEFSSNCSSLFNKDVGGDGLCEIIKPGSVPNDGFYCVDAQTNVVVEKCHFESSGSLSSTQRCCYVESGDNTPLDNSCQDRSLLLGNNIDASNNTNKCNPAFEYGDGSESYYIFDDEWKIVDVEDVDEGYFAYKINAQGQPIEDTKRGVKGSKKFGLRANSDDAGYYQSYSADDAYYCAGNETGGTKGSPCGADATCCQYSPMGKDCLGAGTFITDTPDIGQCKSSKYWKLDTYCADKENHTMLNDCKGDDVTCCAFDKWKGIANYTKNVKNGELVEEYDCDDNFLALDASPKCVRSTDIEPVCYIDDDEIGFTCACQDSYEGSCDENSKPIGLMCYYDNAYSAKYQACGRHCSDDAVDAPASCNKTYTKVNVEEGSDGRKASDYYTQPVTGQALPCGTIGDTNLKYECACPLGFVTKDNSDCQETADSKCVPLGDVCNYNNEEYASMWVNDWRICNDDMRMANNVETCTERLPEMKINKDAEAELAICFDDYDSSAHGYCACGAGFSPITTPGYAGYNKCPFYTIGNVEVYELVAPKCDNIISADYIKQDKPCENLQEGETQEYCVENEDSFKYLCKIPDDEKCPADGFVVDNGSQCSSINEIGTLAAYKTCYDDNGTKKFVCGCKTSDDDGFIGTKVQKCDTANGLYAEDSGSFCLVNDETYYAICMKISCEDKEKDGNIIVDINKTCQEVLGTASRSTGQICQYKNGTKGNICNSCVDDYNNKCEYPYKPKDNVKYCLINGEKYYHKNGSGCVDAELEPCGAGATTSEAACRSKIGSGANARKCRFATGQVGYNCSCSFNTKKGWDEDNCPIRMLLTGGKCGDKWEKCECHPQYNQTKANCADGKLSGGSCRPFNADGSRGEALYAFCTCPAEYNKVCDGPRYVGEGDACQGKYKSCKCVPDPIPENWGDSYYGCPNGVRPDKYIDNGCGGKYYQCVENQCTREHTQTCSGPHQIGVDGCQDDKGNYTRYKSCKCPDGWKVCSNGYVGVGEACSIDGIDKYESCEKAPDCDETSIVCGVNQVGEGACQASDGTTKYSACRCEDEFKYTCDGKKGDTTNGYCKLGNVRYYTACNEVSECTEEELKTYTPDGQCDGGQEGAGDFCTSGGVKYWAECVAKCEFKNSCEGRQYDYARMNSCIRDGKTYYDECICKSEYSELVTSYYADIKQGCCTPMNKNGEAKTTMCPRNNLCDKDIYTISCNDNQANLSLKCEDETGKWCQKISSVDDCGPSYRYELTGEQNMAIGVGKPCCYGNRCFYESYKCPDGFMTCETTSPASGANVCMVSMNGNITYKYDACTPEETCAGVGTYMECSGNMVGSGKYCNVTGFWENCSCPKDWTICEGGKGSGNSCSVGDVTYWENCEYDEINCEEEGFAYTCKKQGQKGYGPVCEQNGALYYKSCICNGQYKYPCNHPNFGVDSEKCTPQGTDNDTPLYSACYCDLSIYSFPVSGGDYSESGISGIASCSFEGVAYSSANLCYAHVTGANNTKVDYFVCPNGTVPQGSNVSSCQAVSNGADYPKYDSRAYKYCDCASGGYVYPCSKSSPDNCLDYSGSYMCKLGTNVSSENCINDGYPYSSRSDALEACGENNVVSVKCVQNGVSFYRCIVDVKKFDTTLEKCKELAIEDDATYRCYGETMLKVGGKVETYCEKCDCNTGAWDNGRTILNGTKEYTYSDSCYVMGCTKVVGGNSITANCDTTQIKLQDTCEIRNDGHKAKGFSENNGVRTTETITLYEGATVGVKCECVEPEGNDDEECQYTLKCNRNGTNSEYCVPQQTDEEEEEE